MNRKFEFKVQPEVLDLRVKIKGVRIQEINNTVYSSSLNDYIDWCNNNFKVINSYKKKKKIEYDKNQTSL